ncbi:hypothetical protein BBJ28_00003320 [Nothophytophthora sp. Chile5]|nr:hypothetical protein BBJ28_00003320 [Nothophytophthora sp. Chile5]
MAARDAVVDRVWGDFKSLCSSLRTAKGEKGFKAAVERLQDFMSDDLHRQLVHRWRSWGLVLNDLLRVVKEELSKYLYPGASGRKRKVTAKMTSKKEPQLGYWHYLRTELEAAHVAGDGPVLHFDPNGRECLRQLFAFSALVVGSDSSSEYEREFETRVETEAWRTIEVIAQFRVYCAVLDKNELTDVLELALGLLERSSSRGLFDNTATAAVRARAIQLLLKNCPFELHEFLPALLEKFAEWFGSIEPNAILDSLTVAVILLETLTDLMRAYFASIGPSMLKYGVKVLKFIARSWGFLPNGLRGYPAEFIMQFLELYRYNADGVPNCKHLVPATLLKEMKMLVKIVVNASELNRMVAHVQSARGSVIGRAKSVLIDFDDQGMRHLACAADIIFHHDRLVSDRITEGEQSDEVSEYSVGDKRPRSTTTTLAWETVVENVCGGPRAEGDLMTAASLSMVSPSYLSVGPSQLRGVGASQLETKQPFDSASWLLLLLSVLTRHGDYYITNRIGDLMLVMKKLGNMLVVKEMGKQQSAALQTLIQLANLSAQYREECGDNFDEHWTFVWHSLLRPELPYARATEGVGLDRGQAGDAVLTLLNCCVSFGLVPIEAIEARSSELWDLPAFRKPTSELLTATKPRAESLSPYARTSMASTCALLSFLLHVQLPPSDGIPTRPIQGGDSFDSGEEIFENEGVSVHSRLLRSVFDQLQTQIFRRDSAPFTGRSASASMKTDMQTEVSSVVYASAIRAFFPQTTVAAPTRETIFLPELIRKLAARSLEECESELTGGELSGFGVSFCMHESGLEYLSQPFSASEDVGPAAFSPVIQAFVNEAANSPGLGWSGGLKTDAIKPENHFEGLAIGLVLAVLFAGEESSASQRRSSDRLRVIPLLKRFLAIAADYLKPAVMEHTRRTQYASEKMMHILMKFHAVILILQGRRTLETCSHPSADPVELRTPSDLRLSIRNIVNALEELLASFSGAGGAENPDTANRPFRTTIFLSQVLTVLRLAGLLYEKRKSQQSEAAPVLLLQCAKKHLETFAGHSLKSSLRMARTAELQCLQVFFRFTSTEFETFEDISMNGTVDEDMSVRVAAAQSLQSMLFMYPEGGPQVFRDCFERLKSLLPGLGAAKLQPGGCEPGWCMDACLSVLLSLYVCACSSHAVLPEVLAAFVGLASSTDSLYATGTPSIISGWLRAIAEFYGYSGVSSLLEDHFCHLWHQHIAASMQPAAENDENDPEYPKGEPAAPRPHAKVLLGQFPLSALLGEECDANTQQAFLMGKIDVILPVAVLHDSIAWHGEEAMTTEERFEFVDELVTLCVRCEDSDDTQTAELRSTAAEQLTTDLFALPFILQSYPDPTLHELALRMLAVAEARAQTSALSFSHLGHITSKMARFTVWDIIQAGSDQLSHSELWKKALAAMKGKYSGFDWKLLNLAELLCDFHVLLLRTERFDPQVTRAVECFQIFVTEIRDALVTNPVLQRLLLSICFQSIKHLTIKDRKEVGSILTLLIRETCECFMKNADTFGKYLGFVVQEISEILACCDAAVQPENDAAPISTDSKRRLTLTGDDQAKMEWVIFAVCNNMASGLGKYVLELDLVPKGISASLDKLNGLITGSRKLATTSASQPDDDASMVALGEHIFRTGSANREHQAKQQIERFIDKENARGLRFYNPLPTSGSLGTRNHTSEGHCRDVQLVGPSQQRAESSATIRLSVVARNIGALRGSSNATKQLYAKLAHALLYLSAEGDGSTYAASLADALGALGALDANEYELSPGNQRGELSRLYKRHFHRSALRETKTTFTLAMQESLLAYLSSLLFERKTMEKADPAVLQEALKTLKSLLSIDTFKALERCRDNRLKAFLNPFKNSSPSNWSSSPLLVTPASQSGGNRRSFPRTTQQHVELWASVNKIGFDSWVCCLTSYLASQSSDLVLKACSALVAIRTDMAVFLFPFVLESILGVSKRGGELSRLAKTVNQGIRFILTGKRNEGGDTAMTSGPQTLNAVSSQPLEVVQLVVHTINFLRETEKAHFVESNGNIQQSPAVGKGKLRAQPPVTDQHQLNEPAYGCVADVDLLTVAVAAVRVKMPYSAMQYVEMWLEKQHGGAIPSLSTLEDEEVGNTLRDILVAAYSFDNNTDGIYGVNDGRTLGSQLVKYNREGEYAKALPLYDVSLQFSDPHSGGRTASDPPRFVEGMLMSLQTLGYKHLLEGYLQSAQQEAKSSTSAGPATVYSQAMKHKYELAWKNLQWEAVLPGLSSSQTAWQTQRTSSHWHQQTLFRALRAIAHDDFPYLQHVTTTAKCQILQSVQLSLRSFESTQDSYTALLRLQSIREIEELAEQMGRAQQDRGVPVISAEIRTGFTASSSSLRHMTSTPTGFEAMPLFNRWQQRYAQIHNDFDKSESLLALEEALLQVSQPSDSVQVLTKLYLNLAAFSRKAGRVAVAYRALTKLEQLDQQGHLGTYEKMQWKLQKAKLLWSQQEGRSAIWMAKKMRSELAMHLKDTSLSSGQTSSLELLHVAVLTITGKWIASQRSESSQVIIEEYFQKATELVNSMDPAAVSERVMDAAKAHFALAEYMADMYQQVGARVTSREWLAGKAVADARRQELAECLAMDEEKRRENQAHIHALNKEVVYDSEERSKVEASVDQFLTGALYSYGKGLSLSPRAELDMVFRVLSLWFNNQNKPHVNRVVQDEVIHVVPSYKFVPLSYQIISRVSGNSGTDTFQTVLSNLVMKLSEQHPHHTLVQLIALKNSGDVEGKGALQFRTNVGEAKSDGAKAFLAQLRKTEQAELLESLDILANAYLQLALFDTRAYHKTGKKIALTDVPILGLNPTKTSATTSFDQCLRDRTRRSKGAVMPAVLTAHLAPRADMDYSAVVRVLSFAPLFSITDSGIHRPKIIYCQGSDGRRYKQLVKGHDDTRQDLVIEQAFETVNQFLAEEHATRKRKLRLRTYRVVPLSPIAGVLEWVENTMPWGSYLVGRSGNKLSAHERYHPQEWKHANCRAKLKNAPNKLAAFSEIQANFTPVFHHFFLEKYPDAAEWYSRRLAYVQSVAVTSIVGYILGIGDRHSQNILIHEDTGELVHIDFGVVFDQGMALFTPETVPFRLTRDMVDGMGVSGVDGVFSRCCEATLQLLRKKSASVVTILEVFVHDPLYRWTLSPLKALRIQEGEQDGGSAVSSRKRRVSRGSGIVDESSSMDDTQPVEGNKTEANSSDAAARALIRVKQKLQGYEDPNGNALSIEGQVKHLMSAAQNPHNLCNLFPGSNQEESTRTMGCMQSVPIEEPSVPDTAAAPAPEAPAVTVPAATDDDPPTELARRRVFATSPKPLPSLEKKSQMLATAYSPRGATDLWEDGTIASVRIPRESLHVRRMIGSGTFTEVYLASYKSWLVALKMLVPERRRSEAHVNTLLAGAKLMATIEHPYIVWLMGVAWDSPTDLCLVSEYMEGGNLRTLLDSYAAGGRPVGFNRQKVTIALHVAYALTYLHSLKPPVLRRDLDSSKILLLQH